MTLTRTSKPGIADPNSGLTSFEMIDEDGTYVDVVLDQAAVAEHIAERSPLEQDAVVWDIARAKFEAGHIEKNGTVKITAADLTLK